MQSTQASSVTVAVQGEIDLATGPTLARKLRRAEARGPQRIVLDLVDLEFMDMAGLRVISDAQQRAAESGHRLVVTRVPERVRRMFDIAGIAATLEIE